MIGRLLDIFASTVGLIVLSPVLAVVGVVIKRDSQGPALFQQERVGRGGRPFVLFKFRTMAEGSASAGPNVTAGGDVRVTRVGRRLRSTKLDELPQLANVFKGDMSLVGPRPEVPRYVALWPPEQRDVILSVRPGITDPMTVELRREEELLARASDPEQYYLEVLLPRKAAAYVDYVRTKTFVGDLRIILGTFRSILGE